MKVALVFPEGEEWGLSAQIHLLADALRTLPETQADLLPLKLGRQSTAFYRELADKLNAPDIDVIHLPHEYSFYGSVLPKETGFWELRYLLKKPVVLTAYNLAPLETLLSDRLLSPARRIANFFHLLNKATRDAILIAPFATAYTIVSTNYERGILIERGANPQYVTVIPDGIPAIVPDTKTFVASIQHYSWQTRPALAKHLSECTPVIAPDLPEFREVQTRRDCLELYDPNIKDDFRQKFEALGANEARRVALSEQARRYAERYSFPKIAVATRRAYAAAISVF